MQWFCMGCGTEAMRGGGLDTLICLLCLYDDMALGNGFGCVLLDLASSGIAASAEFVQ